MSSNVKLWCFILLLPFFIAVGHDVYANFLASDEQRLKLEAFQIDPKSYQNSDLGYIFVKYAPEQFHMARQIIGEDFWNKYLEPVLRQYTFVVSLVPALVFFTWLLFARIFDLWPFVGSAPTISRRMPGSSLRNESASPEFKYKRR